MSRENTYIDLHPSTKGPGWVIRPFGALAMVGFTLNTHDLQYHNRHHPASKAGTELTYVFSHVYPTTKFRYTAGENSK